MQWRIRRPGRIPSTQEAARALAEAGSAEGTVVIAQAQTEGRGREGRVWHSPSGGLYMTAVLRPVGGVGLIPLMAGVAVAETIIADLGAEARLKWPNDVLVGKRKVGGILAETAWSQGEARHTLLGIGVNLNNQLPPDLPEATTLLAELGEEVDIEQFLYDLLERLGQRFRLLERKPSRILDAWRALSSTLGRRVEVVVDSGEKIQGVAVDIDQDGVLLLDTGCGRRGIVSGSLKERYR